MTKFIVIGNPGTGKSTTINCYVGENLFLSGPSRTGSGVTFQLDQKSSQDGRLFLDTPGLSDVVLRRQAAEAIDKALQAGGEFKIAFFCTMEEGRWRNDDLTTMKLVIDATDGQIGEDKYVVIVNKCDEDFMQELEDDPSLKTELVSTLHKTCCDRNVPTTQHVFFAPMVSAMKRKHNVQMHLDPRLKKFLNDMPSIILDGENVHAVQHQQFEELQEEFAKLEHERQVALAQAAEAKAEAEQERRKAAEAESVAEEERKKASDAERAAAEAERLAVDAEKSAEEERRKAADAEKNAEEERKKAAEAQRGAEEAAERAAEESRRAEEALGDCSEAKKQAAEAEATAKEEQRKAAEAKILADEAEKAAKTANNRFAKEKKRADNCLQIKQAMEAQILQIQQEAETKQLEVKHLSEKLVEAKQRSRETFFGYDGAGTKALEYIPVVGNVVGMCHAANGEEEAAARAFTNTTIIGKDGVLTRVAENVPLIGNLVVAGHEVFGQTEAAERGRQKVLVTGHDGDFRKMWRGGD